MRELLNSAANVHEQAANNVSTETGTMSNVQVNNNTNGASDFRSEWVEGYYDEWIYVYNPKLKLLLITYANGDFDNIYDRLVHDKGETFTTKAEKQACNVEEDEVSDAVSLITLKDSSYDTVRIDWSNKDDVALFLE